MKCPELEIFEEFLRGELDQPRLRELELHLESCASCRTVLERERRLDSLLRAQRQDKAPEQLRLRVLEALEPRTSGRALPEWMWVLGMGLAVILMGVVLGRLGSPYFEGLRLWFTQNVLKSPVWKSVPDLGRLPTTNWLGQIPGGISLGLVNLGVAGIILCWGLWQMIKALRR